MVRPARHRRRRRPYLLRGDVWLADRPDDGKTNYASWITNNEDPWAGIIADDTDRPTGTWVPYVVVDDLGKASGRAINLGAKVIRDIIEGPGGTSVLLADPTGALLAVFVPRAGG